MNFENKTVVLGVCGGIAAYKALEVTSALIKRGIHVKVVMTEAATKFTTPLSFQALSQNPVAVDMFEEPKAWEIRHISLAKEADLLAVLPATANTIGKMAHGIADNLLTSVCLATRAPILIAPAMNTNMYTHAATQENMRILKQRGVHFVSPAEGRLACGDSGIGKLAEVDDIVNEICFLLRPIAHDLKGKRVLVTAGATRESLDPVRFITNHSSGKMGCALANAARLRGADVTLVCGHMDVNPPQGVTVLPVTSAVEMYDAVMAQAEDSDIIIKAAAVGDYRPESKAEQKIKKNADMTLKLTKNPDILQELGNRYGGKKLLIGFCMETEDLLKNARKKLEKKHLDLIAANSLTEPGAGFGTDTNAVTLIGKDGRQTRLEIADKLDIAMEILDEAVKITK